MADSQPTFEVQSDDARSLPSGVDETATVTPSSDFEAASSMGFGPPVAIGEVGTLGPYRIVKELGRGGMGTVYAAVDTRLERRVALKVMLPQYAANATAKERFLREARAAAGIKHDNIVTIYEADDRKGVPYIAMEFLEGYSLDEYLKRKGTPPIVHVLRIAAETAAGLAAAHKIGLVHRDIKPSNIWLEVPHGRVKVLDFGLAKPVDTDVELTKSGAVVGTPAYMSPEQAKAEKVDHRADLFSLGAMLYRLCAGRLPFQGNTTMAVLMALGTEEPTPLRELNPNVPDSLALLIQQLLAKKAEARPTSAAEVVQRLRSIAAELAVPQAQRVEPTMSQQVVYVPMQVTAAPADDNPFANIEQSLTELASADSAEPRPERKKPNRPFPFALVGSLAFFALVLIAGVMIIIKNKDGTETKIEVPDTSTVTVKDKNGKTLAKIDPPKTLPSAAGKYALEFASGDTAIAENVPHRNTTEITIEAWVTLKANEKAPAQVIAMLSNGSLNVMGFGPDGGTGLEFYTFHSEVTVPKAFTSGERLHVAAVNNGKERRIYKNGKLIATKHDPGVPNPEGDKPERAKLTLGFQEFEGTIEQVRISTKPIYDGDFTPPAKFTKEKDTFVLYTFEEGQGDTLKDSSGNNYHAKIKGAKWVTVGDSDRKGAEWVLSVGGRVSLNGEETLFKTPAELPKSAFKLTGFSLNRENTITEAGLANIKNCTNVTRLLLYTAQISEAGWANFAGFKGLLYLDLGGSPVTETGLAHFKNCTNLTQLFLHDNGVSDKGLVHFKGCKNLERLYLDNSTLTDQGLAYFKDCKNLSSLALASTAITDQGLAQLHNCQQMSILSIGSTKITNVGLQELKNFPNLLHFWLGNTKITDDGLVHCKQCKKLAVLGLADTAITDAGLAHLKECKNLKELYLKGTKVTPKAIDEFHAALPECKIEYDGGTIEPKK